jgi:hypothetical protein
MLTNTVYCSAGDIRMIRPLVYVREQQTKDFAYQHGLPVIPENCPGCFEAPQQRYRIKRLLASQEQRHPRLFSSMLKAMEPLIRDNGTWGPILGQQQAPSTATTTTSTAAAEPTPENTTQPNKVASTPCTETTNEATASQATNGTCSEQ